MKKLIDDKGRILGKVNIIDFTVVLIILILIPAFFVSQKLIRNALKAVALYDPHEHTLTYRIERKCPNCAKPVSIKIDKGTPFSELIPYKTVCKHCRVELTLQR
jgi:hypothetical protein